MSKENNLAVRIEERLIALHNSNEESHKSIQYQLEKLTEQVKETNGKVRTNCEKLAVLDENKETQKWINRTISAGFIGGIITKIMGLW